MGARERLRAGASAILLLASNAAWLPAQADDTVFAERAEVRDWLGELAAAEDLDAAELAARFASVEPDPEVLELIARPAERTLAWREYRPIFLTDERIADGRAYLAEHRDVFDRAEATYGVRAEVIAAIIGVETFYGRITGRFNVLRALATLGFDYPPRADFFRSELGEYLVLADAEGWDTDTRLGSYAGAMGLPQFISSSYRAYAVDGDGDGRRDLAGSVPDAVLSVANYLARHGWQAGETIAERWSGAPDAAAMLVRDALRPAIAPAAVRSAGFDSAALQAAESRDEPVTVMRFEAAAGAEWVVGYKNFYAITRYNHSRLYARAVVQLAFALD